MILDWHIKLLPSQLICCSAPSSVVSIQVSEHVSHKLKVKSSHSKKSKGA